MLILEELEPWGSGDQFAIRDSDTKEPVAVATKLYGRTHSVDWHPTFLAIHPEVAKSREIPDLRRLSPESKSAAVAQIDRIHQSLAERGFKDQYEHSAPDENGERTITNRKTGENLAIAKKTDTYSNNETIRLHPDFIAKHNIAPEVAQAETKHLSGDVSNFHDRFESRIAEHQKQKHASGISSHTASTSVFHIHTTPEEASAAHAGSLMGSMHSQSPTLNRISPTHFVVNAGSQEIHSTVVGDKIYQFSHRSNEGKPNPKSF